MTAISTLNDSEKTHANPLKHFNIRQQTQPNEANANIKAYTLSVHLTCEQRLHNRILIEPTAVHILLHVDADVHDVVGSVDALSKECCDDNTLETVRATVRCIRDKTTCDCCCCPANTISLRQRWNSNALNESEFGRFMNDFDALPSQRNQQKKNIGATIAIREQAALPSQIPKWFCIEYEK